jgi:hypothetical protein
LLGALLAMQPATAERASQIRTTSVPGMSEEPNAAPDAVGHARFELGIRPQDQVQRDLILPNKRSGRILLMPIRPNREKLLDGYDKKARLSVMI